MAVDKAYAFDGPHGKASLLDLKRGPPAADGLSSFFFAPEVLGWPGEG
jgi:hypothetical protein